jgi:heptosyltransferase-1
LQKFLIGSLRHLASPRRAGEYRPEEIRSVLAVELSRLGDVILMLPTLTRLQKHFSKASIIVLVSRNYVPLLSSFDTRLTFIGVMNPETPPGLIQALRFARGGPFDMAISMSMPRRNAIVALASDSRFRLGYFAHLSSHAPFLSNTPVESFGFSLPISASYGRENIYTRPSKIITAMGLSLNSDEWHVRPKQDVYETQRKRLEEQGAIPETEYVVIFPFSGWKFRDWGLTRYVELGKQIASHLSYDLVFCCEQGNRPRLERAMRSTRPESSLRIVSSSLLDTAVLMKGASLVVSGDSGPQHLAAALDVRAVGLYGPAAPELTSPLRDDSIYLYKAVECSPCDQRVCVRPDRPCMELHNVNEVFSAVANVLASPIVKEPATNDV